MTAPMMALLLAGFICLTVGMGGLLLRSLRRKQKRGRESRAGGSLLSERRQADEMANLESDQPESQPGKHSHHRHAPLPEIPLIPPGHHHGGYGGGAGGSFGGHSSHHSF